MDITIEQQIKCVARELKMRETVYPRRVQHGHMSAQQAENEIECMKAVLETLKQQAPPQPEQTSLFGG